MMQTAWPETSYEPMLLATGERAESGTASLGSAPVEFLERVRTPLSVLQECTGLLERDLGGMMDSSSRQLMHLLERAVAEVTLCVDRLESPEPGTSPVVECAG